MKLAEVRTLLHTAMTTGKITPDVVMWLDRLRSRGWPSANVAPFTYNDLLAFMRHKIPNLDRAAWDAFLYQIDSLNEDA